MNVVGQMQLKNAVERVLHVPGNYSGGVLEMALVCDYHISEAKLKETTAEIIDCLKRHSEVFRNVRLNLIKWVDDGRIVKEIVPMAYVRMGRVFEDYALLWGEGSLGEKMPKTMQELTRQLKLFYARSKVVIIITDGSYTVGDITNTKANLYPFLYRKLLIFQDGKVTTGMEWMKDMLVEKTDREEIANNVKTDKNVIFDMDGVLFDTERLYAEMYEEVAADWGLGDVREAVLGCIGRNANDSRAFFTSHVAKDFPYDDYVKETIKRYKEKEEREGLPMKKGVVELLSYLKEQGYRIGLASSTRRQKVLECIEKAKIRDYFQVVVGGDMVEHSKPNPEIYLIACKELGVNPEETYAIEDSPNGIRAAHSAGMKAIMVPDMIAPDEEMKSLAQVICEDLLAVKDYLAGNRQN